MKPQRKLHCALPQNPGFESPAVQEACHICTGSAEGVMRMEDNLDSSLRRALDRADVPRFLQVSAALAIAPRPCRQQGTWIPVWLFVVPSAGAALFGLPVHGLGSSLSLLGCSLGLCLACAAPAAEVSCMYSWYNAALP